MKVTGTVIVRRNNRFKRLCWKDSLCKTEQEKIKVKPKSALESQFLKGSRNRIPRNYSDDVCQFSARGSHMGQPKISVITICWNAEKTILETIKSVLSQNYPALEYVIIDGGSTDKTLQIINEYRDQLTHIISEPDKGISDAFNKGIRLASGDIVAILNADDTFLPETLKSVAQEYKNSPSAILYADMFYRDPETSSQDIVKPDFGQMPWQMTLCHVSAFVPKSVYDAIGFYSLDYKVAMDYDFFLRCMKSKVIFKYVPKVLGVMNKGGVSFTHWNRSIQEQARAQIENGIQKLWIAKLFMVWRLLRYNLVSFAYRYHLTFLFKPYLKAKLIFKK